MRTAFLIILIFVLGASDSSDWTVFMATKLAAALLMLPMGIRIQKAFKEHEYADDYREEVSGNLLWCNGRK